MRRLEHLMLSPPSRFARLLLGEKKLACEWVAAEDSTAHLPVLTDLDGTRCAGLWAIVDYLEGAYPERPLVPAEPAARGETLRLLDWAMGWMQDSITRKIVFEKAPSRYTGAPPRRTPDMDMIRQGREALKLALTAIGEMADRNGCLAAKDCSIADLAVAAHLSALDYFGEVPWKDFPVAAEWYLRIKSRPSFRPLLSDRMPGQPPVMDYAELDA